MNTGLLKRVPFHPILFSIYPVVSLYVINYSEIPSGDFFRAILLVFLPSMLLWAGVTALLHNWKKSAIIVSVFIFMFFSFRYFLFGITIVVYKITASQYYRNFLETKIALIGWFFLGVLLYSAVTYRVIKEKWNQAVITLLLNIISCILLVIPFFDYIKPEVDDLMKTPVSSIEKFRSDWKASIDAQPCLLSKSLSKLPDIYYIVLDGYGRDDVLSLMYNVDNSEFLSFLEREGFYVARDSIANYKHTQLALSAYLNMDYLERLGEETNLDTNYVDNLGSLIAYNSTFHQLRCLGYQIVSFDTGFSPTSLNTADKKYNGLKGASGIENLLINNSPLTILLLEQQYDWHRERILYILDELKTIATEAGKPKFVFAHILAPHPPFVFGIDGQPVYAPREFRFADGNDFKIMASKEEYIQGYHNQVIYITAKTKEAIEGILQNSKAKPIIIVQGDHGPASEVDMLDMNKANLWERMSILNAYYLPDNNDSELYPGITPVNTFRVIFNEYFGGAFPLLADKGIYASGLSNYERTDITDRIPHNKLLGNAMTR